jgi:acyl dehydratase
VTGAPVEPFDALVAGARFSTQGRTVTEADVVAFAALTGDRHPQHLDAAWARTSLFGERVAHGLLVLSYATGLVAFDPDRTVALRGVREAVFKQAVRLGDTIHVEGEVVALTPLDERHGLVGCRLRVVNGRGLLFARAQLDLLWAREPEPTPPAEPSAAVPLLI